MKTLKSLTIGEAKKLAKKLNKFKKLKTGFDQLDELTGGLEPAQLFTLAARSGVGKTTFMLNIILNILEDINKSRKPEIREQSPLLVSLEMSAANIYNQLISIRMKKKKGPKYKAKYWLKNTTLRILDPKTSKRSKFTVEDLEKHIIEHNKQSNKPIKTIFIDYIQIMDDKETTEEVQKLKNIMKKLKLLAESQKIHIFAIAQLNRNIENRKEDQAPKLSDLQGSDAIGQWSECVFFLHKDEYESHRKRFNTILTIGKNRYGATSKILLTFNPEAGTFEE